MSGGTPAPAVRTPVALSVFNRPDTTQRVFDAISAARPSQLFVFADGPRSTDEEEACEQARAVTQHVPWDCHVSYDFASENMGARRRYSSGVSWVFSHVDEAIIFDDDCLPDPTFFPFCQTILDHYRDDERVMMVCGTNYLERWKDDIQSYHFSHLGSVWGWATWKRAWRFYDVDMADWADRETKDRIRALFADDDLYESQARRFDRLLNDPADLHSWDLPWSFARLSQGGLAVVPSVNMVENLGNAEGRGLPKAHPLANLKMEPMAFPLRHPEVVAVDRLHDRKHVQRVVEYYQAQENIPAATTPSLRARILRPLLVLRKRLRRRRDR